MNQEFIEILEKAKARLWDGKSSCIYGVEEKFVCFAIGQATSGDNDAVTSDAPPELINMVITQLDDNENHTVVSFLEEHLPWEIYRDLTGENIQSYRRQLIDGMIEILKGNTFSFIEIVRSVK